MLEWDCSTDNNNVARRAVRLIWLAAASKGGKQHDVETGVASVNTKTYLVAKNTKTQILSTPYH